MVEGGRRRGREGERGGKGGTKLKGRESEGAALSFQNKNKGNSILNDAHHVNTYAADHCRMSVGCVLMAALVNSLSMSGSSGGMRICSAVYIGPADSGSIAR